MRTAIAALSRCRSEHDLEKLHFFNNMSGDGGSCGTRQLRCRLAHRTFVFLQRGANPMVEKLFSMQLELVPAANSRI